MSLLDPVLVSRMASMELRARAVAEGVLAGRHRSRRRGRAMEFSGHRPYTPSDDWRKIDWRAFARTDRFVVREEEQETNRRALLLLDASASMGFHGPGRISKHRCGAILLAALAYGLIRQGESVGAGVFSESLGELLVPRVGKARLSPILELFDGPVPAGRTGLAAALDGAAERMGRRTWIVVASDFWSDEDGTLAALRRLRARKHEVSVLWPLDPLETDLDLEGDFLFKDVETGLSLRASAGELKERYRALSAERLERLRAALSALRIPSVPCMTHRSLDESLRAFLEGAA